MAAHNGQQFEIEHVKTRLSHLNGSLDSLSSDFERLGDDVKQVDDSVRELEFLQRESQRSHERIVDRLDSLNDTIAVQGKLLRRLITLAMVMLALAAGRAGVDVTQLMSLF